LDKNVWRTQFCDKAFVVLHKSAKFAFQYEINISNPINTTMNEITNEIERPQRWGALAAGCGDAPKYLTGLKSNSGH
jgi:hypothetical protein